MAADTIIRHPSRVARALIAKGASHRTVTLLCSQVRVLQQRPQRRLLKWARDDRHATALRHRLPARLRRHVHVESWDD